MTKTCSIEGCDNPVKGRGWCGKHHQRWLKHGDPNWTRPPRKRCKYEGCDAPAIGRGWCRKHYDRARQGSPMEGRPEPIRHCRMPNCWKPHHSRGLCQMHVRRLLRWGDPFFDGQHYPECHIEGCFKKRISLVGYCVTHYDRYKRFGDPLHISEGQTHPTGIDLPMGPIDELLLERGGFAAVMSRLGPEYAPEAPARDRVEKYLDRARRNRGGWIDLAHADHFAVKVLGTHPALIWGDDYWTAEEPEELMAA